MASLLLVLGLSLLVPDAPWPQIALTIEKDRSVSSDTVTICRVRAENRGSRSWPGRDLAFEASALDGGIVVARERGRFGLTLNPRESLETLIAFHGLYDRFEVHPLEEGAGRSSASGRRRSGSGSRGKSAGKRKKH